MSTTHACGHGNRNQAGWAQKTCPLCAAGLSLHVRLPPAQLVALSPPTGDPLGGIPAPNKAQAAATHRATQPRATRSTSPAGSDQLQERGYALNACVSPDLYTEILTHQVKGLGGGALLRCFSFEGGALLSRISGFYTGGSLLSSPGEETMRSLWPSPTHAGSLIPDFQPPEL